VGTPTPTYQWERSVDGGNWTTVTGATSSTFSLIAQEADNGALFRLKASNSAGSATSNPATLQVNTVPTILTQPLSLIKSVGASAHFSLQATARGSLTYQWRKDGTSLPGRTGASLDLTGLGAGDAGAYDVVVTSTLQGVSCNRTSGSAQLQVVALPSIGRFDPGAGTIRRGTSTLLTAVFSGSGRIDPGIGPVISGVPVTTGNLDAATTFILTVLNEAGDAATAETTVTLLAEPTITGQPQPAVAAYGQTATFSVAAVELPGLTYQWRRNGNVLPGATAPSYTTGPLPFAMSGSSYSVDLTANGITLTSTPALLTVEPPTLDRTSTLEGTVTTDGGVRDDIASAIASWPVTEPQKVRATAVAQTLQSILTSVPDTTSVSLSRKGQGKKRNVSTASNVITASNLFTQLLDSVDAWVDYKVDSAWDETFLGDLVPLTMNTRARVDQYLKWCNEVAGNAWALPVHAGADAQQPGYSIAYFNGVDNTVDGAFASLLALRRALGESHTPAGTSQARRLQYLLCYNPTHGVPADISEVFAQRAQDDMHWQGFWTFLKTGNPGDMINRIVNRMSEENAARLTPEYLTRYGMMASNLQALIAQGESIVCVAHSQGNLFVNGTYDVLNSRGLAGSMKIVHVAPAVGTLNGQYTLGSVDLVIRGLKTLLPETVDWNVLLDSEATVPFDWKGHGFQEIYMNPWLPTRDRVLGHIRSALNDFSVPGASVPSCVVDLLWDGPGDMDLHVIEPDGAEVSAQAPEGSAGHMVLTAQDGYGPEQYAIRGTPSGTVEGEYQLRVNNLSTAAGVKFHLRVRTQDGTACGDSFTVPLPTQDAGAAAATFLKFQLSRRLDGGYEASLAPRIRAFGATPTSLPAPGTATLQWDVAGATSLRLDPGALDVTGRTSVQVPQDQNTAYILTATNAYGSVTGSVTVLVTGTHLIQDDFSGAMIDLNLWTPYGFNVTQANGTLTISEDVTDTYAKITSRLINATTAHIHMRHWMSPANNYFMPTIHLNGTDGSIFDLIFMRSAYGPDYGNDVAQYDRVLCRYWNSSGNHYEVVGTLNSSTYYNRWTETTLDYNALTGEVSIDLDSDQVMDLHFFLPVENRKQLKDITIGGYGWWTGHQHILDFFEGSFN
jgi:hypothetical protein